MSRRYVHNPEFTSSIEAFRVGRSRAFVIGSLEKRVTFIGQQTRALVFARDLARAYDLRNKEILVVGGGIAGTTAAIALSREGAKVTLAERNPNVLLAQEKAAHRFVHPRAYDWGLDPSSYESPLSEGDPSPLPWPYTWSAKDASSVLSELREAFRVCCRGSESDSSLPSDCVHSMRVACSCVVSSLELGASDESKIRATLSDDPQDYDFVVLTVGFGPERPHLEPVPSAITTRSYWQPEDLLSVDLISNPAKILVSGQGDGALTDAIRAAYGGAGFSHASVLKRFSQDIGFQMFVRALVIWSDSNSTTANGYSDDLATQCEAVWREQDGEQWFKSLRPSCSPNHVADPDGSQPGVWILGGRSGNSYLGGHAAFMHRAIVWILIKNGYISPLKRGRIKTVEESRSGYVVEFVRQDEGKLHFDRVVLRHGPDPVRHLSELGGLKEHVQKFTDISSLRLLPPKVDEALIQWSNLGRSVLILPNLPGVRFLSDHEEGPWMMERPVTQATWAHVRKEPQLTEDKSMEHVSYGAAMDFLIRFEQVLRDAEVQDLRDSGLRYSRYSGLRCRLPKLDEWLRFAGCPEYPNTIQRKYPWGDAPVTSARANVAGGKDDVTTRSGRCLGRGPAGHVDLIGEVWEWCDVDEIRSVLVGGSKATFVSDSMAPLWVDRDNFCADDIGFRIVLEKDRHTH